MPAGVSTISATPARRSDALLLASVDAIGFEGDKEQFRKLRRIYWEEKIPTNAQTLLIKETPVLVVKESALYIGWGLRRYDEQDRLFWEAYFSPGRESDAAVDVLLRNTGVDIEFVHMTDPHKVDIPQAV